MKMKNFIKRLTVSAVSAIMLSSVNAENTNIGFKEGNFSGWKMETGDYIARLMVLSLMNGKEL